MSTGRSVWIVVAMLVGASAWAGMEDGFDGYFYYGPEKIVINRDSVGHEVSRSRYRNGDFMGVSDMNSLKKVLNPYVDAYKFVGSGKYAKPDASVKNEPKVPGETRTTKTIAESISLFDYYFSYYSAKWAEEDRLRQEMRQEEDRLKAQREQQELERMQGIPELNAYWKYLGRVNLPQYLYLSEQMPIEGQVDRTKRSLLGTYEEYTLSYLKLINVLKGETSVASIRIGSSRIGQISSADISTALAGALASLNQDPQADKALTARLNSRVLKQLKVDPLGLIALLVDKKNDGLGAFSEKISELAQLVRNTRSPEFVDFVENGLYPFLYSINGTLESKGLGFLSQPQYGDGLQLLNSSVNLIRVSQQDNGGGDIESKDCVERLRQRQGKAVRR